MDFINEFGFDVIKGKSKDFQQWLSNNEEKLAQSAPEGWEYLGTYAAVISTEKDAGDYRQLWKHHSYGDMDGFAAAMRDSGTPFAQLMDESVAQFVDQESGHFSQSILKAVVDVSLWGES